MGDELHQADREELLLLYQVTVGDLTYFKSQQWSLTNYALLLLAGLAGVNQLLADPTTVERQALIVLAIAVVAAAMIVLSKLQSSIECRQERLKATRGYLGAIFHAAWCAGQKDWEYFHSVWFLRAAIVLGAAIVCWLVIGK